MKVKITPAIGELLHGAAHDDHLSQALRSTASTWEESKSAPWGVLRDLCAGIRAARQDGSGPWLHEMCQGGGVELPSPPGRAKTKSPELEAHLERLRRKLEQDSYDRMVRDVTKKEREAQQKAEHGLRTYRQQMSFGLHVVVMMGTFYAFGHALGLAIGPSGSKLYPLAIGLISMVGALIMETVLFVIRTNFEPRRVPAPEVQQPENGSGAQAPPADCRQQQGQGQQPGQQQQQPSRGGRRGGAAGGPAASEGSSSSVGGGGREAAQQQQQQQPKPAVAKKED